MNIGVDAAQTKKFTDLTQYELAGLNSQHNLGDAHTHQTPVLKEREIIASLPKIWEWSTRCNQAEAEVSFINSLFGFHRQDLSRTARKRSLLSYAASVSMGIAAAYFASQKYTVTLLEPCFDNLHQILRQYDIPVSPINEEHLASINSLRQNLADKVVGDVLLLVDPNNPTGTSVFDEGNERFECIVDFCARTGKLLMLDCSFSSFSRDTPQKRPDLYSILDASGVSYLLLEDTGKTWATLDVKCGLLTPSEDINDAVRDIHTGVILNVSPFALNLLQRFINVSDQMGEPPIMALIRENLRTLRKAAYETPLIVQHADVLTSVAWIKIDHVSGATNLQRHLMRRGIYALPGSHFYWNSPQKGDNYIRVALSRDVADFTASVDALRSAVKEFEHRS